MSNSLVRTLDQRILIEEIRESILNKIGYSGLFLVKIRLNPHKKVLK